MTLTLNWVNISLNKSNTDNNKEMIFTLKVQHRIVCEGKLSVSNTRVCVSLIVISFHKGDYL